MTFITDSVEMKVNKVTEATRREAPYFANNADPDLEKLGAEPQ